jgi:hypothetical protein
MTEAEKAQTKALSGLFQEQDEEIRRIMAMEGLSEEERQAKIDALRAETRRKQQEILMHQAQRKEMEREMDVALGRYEDMVAEQEKETEAAVAEGHLAPSVVAVEKNLHKVGYEVPRTAPPT